jgi:hypothetical protein
MAMDHQHRSLLEDIVSKLEWVCIWLFCITLNTCNISSHTVDKPDQKPAEAKP